MRRFGALVDAEACANIATALASGPALALALRGAAAYSRAARAFSEQLTFLYPNRQKTVLGPS